MDRVNRIVNDLDTIAAQTAPGPIRSAVSWLVVVWATGFLYFVQTELALDLSYIRHSKWLGILNTVFWLPMWVVRWIARGSIKALDGQINKYSVVKQLLDKHGNPKKDCGVWDYMTHPVECYRRHLLNKIIGRIPQEAKDRILSGEEAWRNFQQNDDKCKALRNYQAAHNTK